MEGPFHISNSDMLIKPIENQPGEYKIKWSLKDKNGNFETIRRKKMTYKMNENWKKRCGNFPDETDDLTISWVPWANDDDGEEQNGSILSYIRISFNCKKDNSRLTFVTKIPIYNQKDLQRLEDFRADKNAKEEREKRKREEEAIPNPILEEECPICLTPLGDKESVRTNCGHKFHKECIQRSLQIKRECPLCRQLIDGTTVIPKTINGGRRRTKKYRQTNKYRQTKKYRQTNKHRRTNKKRYF